MLMVVNLVGISGGTEAEQLFAKDSLTDRKTLLHEVLELTEGRIK